jgi:hypothetical protein
MQANEGHSASLEVVAPQHRTGLKNEADWEALQRRAPASAPPGFYPRLTAPSTRASSRARAWRSGTVFSGVQRPVDASAGRAFTLLQSQFRKKKEYRFASVPATLTTLARLPSGELPGRTEKRLQLTPGWADLFGSPDDFEKPPAS